MELGLTIPLQRHWKRRVPPCGREADRRFCWDLHVIPLLGRDSLLAVHCHSRYAFVLFDLSRLEWDALERTFFGGLVPSLAAVGVPANVTEDYLHRAGAARFTGTHGRREVAFLNRAWDDAAALDYCLAPASREQPLLDHAVNARPSRCVGFEGLAPAADRLILSLTGRDST